MKPFPSLTSNLVQCIRSRVRQSNSILQVQVTLAVYLELGGSTDKYPSVNTIKCGTVSDSLRDVLAVK